MRAGSFIPRMVKKFNSLDMEYKQLPAMMVHGRHGTEVERFEALKYRLREMCLWEDLGFPHTWPANLKEAMLDGGEEIYGGLDMKSSEDENDEPET